MEDVIHFAVSGTAVFYDAFSEKIISPAMLSFHEGENPLKPIVKENSFAVFINLPKDDTAIRVTSALYCDEAFSFSKEAGSPDSVIYISLYPCRAYPKKQDCLIFEGRENGLLSLSLIGIKKSLWLKLSDYNSENDTILVENLLGGLVPMEIGLYLPKEQQFRIAKLGRKNAEGRYVIKGDFTPAELKCSSPVKLYRAEVKPSGEFFILTEKTGGDYIAAFCYAKKTIRRILVENGDKVVLKGGG